MEQRTLHEFSIEELREYIIRNSLDAEGVEFALNRIVAAEREVWKKTWELSMGFIPYSPEEMDAAIEAIKQIRARGETPALPADTDWAWNREVELPMDISVMDVAATIKKVALPEEKPE